MEHGNDEIEDQVSINEESSDQVSESMSEIDHDEVVQNPSPYKFEDFTQIGMARVEEGIAEYQVIKRRFLYGMGSLAKETNVVAIHKNSSTNVTVQAKRESFRIFSDAMARKRGGNPNVNIAWYGSSRDEVTEIISHGFSQCEEPKPDAVTYGVGVHLVANFSLDGAFSSVMDETGLKHIVLCRVILGKPELLKSGSKQKLPSSQEFDSGVDNLFSPTRYVIWSVFMNTHIIPEYLISFTAPGIDEVRARPKKLPTSPWISFPALIYVLSRILSPTNMSGIVQGHLEYRARKLTRPQLIQRMRENAGDRLLISILNGEYPNNNNNILLLEGPPNATPPSTPTPSDEAPNDVAPDEVPSIESAAAPSDAPNDVAPNDVPSDVAADPNDGPSTDVDPNDVPSAVASDVPGPSVVPGTPPNTTN